MAKSFVRISLATKFRLLFGVAVLGIIAAALVLPWYFMELLAEQGVERPAAELTRLRLSEWARRHPDTSSSDIASLYVEGRELEGGREGPTFVSLLSGASQPTDDPLGHALNAFGRSGEDLAVFKLADEGRPTYRCFRAVRANSSCLTAAGAASGCHGLAAPPDKQFQPGQLVGVIRMTMPGSMASGALAWWTRGSIVAGGALAAFLALLTFAIITQRLVLKPVRELRDVADKVAEGDLTARSTIRTGDELQRLGDSFNEMVGAIDQQHEKLRAANRALDLRLHELAEANITLLQASKVKNEFLANVSHELRTPLNSIIGFADLLSDSQDERIRRYGQNIGTAAKNLLNMINDLLDLAKIEGGRAEVRLDKVSLTDVCQTLSALMQPLADKKQIAMKAELEASVPLIVTDGGKLQQILYNLLSNAIKFTPAGGQVVVRSGMARAQPGGKSEDEVFVSVADTGPGIAEADQQHIFEKFYQIDRSLTKESAGAGLGLARSRELANLLNGRLALKSSPGHGAEFTLFLPMDGRSLSPQKDQATGQTPEA